MGEKVNYALVGLFVIVLGGALVVAVLWLGYGQPTERYRTYAGYFEESVSGLSEGAAVRYRGVEVGRVQRIDLDREDPSRVEVLLDIEPDAPIKTDTIALLASHGLTGLAFVELTGGSRDAPRLEAPPGAPYPVIETGPSLFVRLDTAVSTLLEEMRGTVTALGTVGDQVSHLLDSQNIEVSAEILRNVRNVTASLADQSADLAAGVEHVNRIAADAARVSGELPEVLDRVRQTLGALERTASAIADAATGIGGLAEEARGELRGLAQAAVPEVSRALSQVRELAETLNRLAQTLERDPAILLRGRGSQPPGPGE